MVYIFFLNTMYMTLNIAVLGFVSTSTQVGYYTTSSKVFTIVLAFYTAFTGVMLPRMSSLVSEGEMVEFKNLISKSISILFAFSIPLIIATTFLAPQIINIIAGPGYEGAYLPTIISMPLIFVVGYEQILIVQILTPLKEDKAKLINSVIGASVGLIGNIILVKYMLAVGATIVWALSEFSVLVSAQVFVTKLINIRFPFERLFTYLVSYLPLSVAIIIIKNICGNVILLFTTVVILIIVYFMILECLVLKNQDVLNLTKTIIIKVKNEKD